MLGIAKKLVSAGRRSARSALLPILRPRRFEACCCGLSKSGTHSMSAIFENYRTQHHPDPGVRLELASSYLKGEIDDRAEERPRDNVYSWSFGERTMIGIGR